MILKCAYGRGFVICVYILWHFLQLRLYKISHLFFIIETLSKCDFIPHSCDYFSQLFLTISLTVIAIIKIAALFLIIVTSVNMSHNYHFFTTNSHNCDFIYHNYNFYFSFLRLFLTMDFISHTMTLHVTIFYLYYLVIF